MNIHMKGYHSVGSFIFLYLAIAVGILFALIVSHFIIHVV